MPLQSLEALPGLHIPKENELVLAAGEGAATVRRKDDALDQAGVSVEASDLVPCVHIPKSHRPVFVAGKRAATVLG
jgi:hypothetical protein